eukprot:SAG11_NODE_4016_length_2106_cov_1.443448_1_plen_74_part_00
MRHIMMQRRAHCDVHVCDVHMCERLRPITPSIVLFDEYTKYTIIKKPAQMSLTLLKLNTRGTAIEDAAISHFF